MSNQLLDELFGIRGVKSLRIPRGGHPSPDRGSALNQGRGVDALAPS